MIESLRFGYHLIKDNYKKLTLAGGVVLLGYYGIQGINALVNKPQNVLDLEGQTPTSETTMSNLTLDTVAKATASSAEAAQSLASNTSAPQSRQFFTLSLE